AEGVTALAIGDPYERIGYLCAYGPDIDEDGSNELWIFTAGSSELGVFYGGSHLTSGGLDLSEDADVTYSFSSADPEPVSLSLIGDWNGDGTSEIAIGLDSESSTQAGQVWIYDPTVDADIYTTDGAGYTASSDLLATIEGVSAEGMANYGQAVSVLPGDLDADGVIDMVVGDYGYSDSTGAVYITFGPTD
ncbi:MAG: hypothetical protein QGG40_05480, partial [Myxococcota bacterium]|nr:hypothetical protein [Myxococcota bacterium]